MSATERVMARPFGLNGVRWRSLTWTQVLLGPENRNLARDMETALAYAGPSPSWRSRQMDWAS